MHACLKGTKLKIIEFGEHHKITSFAVNYSFIVYFIVYQDNDTFSKTLLWTMKMKFVFFLIMFVIMEIQMM